jgi:hypothetical protein
MFGGFSVAKGTKHFDSLNTSNDDLEAVAAAANLVQLLQHVRASTTRRFRRQECRLVRCSNTSHHFRLGEAPPQHFVGQTSIDVVCHSTRLGCQFVGAFEHDQRIERE